jgi:hypothetical protein
MATTITAAQVNTVKQTMRNITVRIDVLNYDYSVGGSLSGNVIDGNVSINSNSDIRRTLSIATVVTDQINIDVNSTAWFDKYIQVYVGIDEQATGETAWTNMGIYIINQPTYNYDAETFTLSFEAVDLMGLLTGLRKGNLLEEYFIPQGSNVKEVMTAVMTENSFTKYVISECTNVDGSIQEVPYDMSFDLGSTWYNILDTLRQILPQYQIYFDADGVFHYEQLPLTDSEPVRIDDAIWHENVLNESINIDFQSVKNKIKVYGATHDASFFPAETNVAENVITFDVAELTDDDLYDYAMIGFVLDSSVVTNQGIQIKLKDGVARTLENYNGGWTRQLQADTYYTIMYVESSNIWQLLGHYQAIGEWQEDNPDSPFYVGNTDMTYWAKNIQMIAEGGYVTPYIWVEGLPEDLGANTKIGFKILGSQKNIFANLTSFYLNGIQKEIGVSGTSQTSIIYNESGTYYIELYPNGNWYWMGETNPQSTFGIVPLVLYGGDYDNIMSDELAVQRAKWEIYQRCRLNDAITIESVPIYWLDVGWKVAYTPLGGTVTNQYMVDSVHVNLAHNGTQSISLSRFFPYYESTT